jgi:hypothetical protein
LTAALGGGGLGEQSGTTFFAQAKAPCADRHYMTVMQQAVQDRGGNDGIAEHCPHSATARLLVINMLPRS